MRKNEAKALESSPLNPSHLEIRLQGGFSGSGEERRYYARRAAENIFVIVSLVNRKKRASLLG